VIQFLRYKGGDRSKQLVMALKLCRASVSQPTLIERCTLLRIDEQAKRLPEAVVLFGYDVGAVLAVFTMDMSSATARAKFQMLIDP
jgi:hypothetical protein